jgi:hypothetical protein
LDVSGIDVNLVVADATAAELRGWMELMAEHGLAGAWVTPRAARTGDPAAGDALAEACAGIDALQVMPVLVPPTGAPGALERAQEIAASATLRVVRLCPHGHGYPLVDWTVSPLPELCDRERMAMLLDFAPSDPPWRDIVDLARRHPALPLVAIGRLTGATHTVPAVLDATANVLVDLSGHPDPRAVPGLVATFGAHRFVWGSGGSPGAMAGRSRLEGLAEEDGAAILGGNAAALGAGTYAETFL